VDERTSSDVVARENSLVNLTCEAEGSPEPELRWRREDGDMIRYQGGTGEAIMGYRGELTSKLGWGHPFLGERVVGVPLFQLG
jgi:hypothetical protein